MKYSQLTCCFGACLLMTACAQTSTANKAEAIGMANPAATHCINLGGQYQVEDTKDGQTGRCLYQEKNWDAWELYRQHQSKQ